MIQNVNVREKINVANHDYQRMRKLAKKRRNGLLNRFNRERAEEEKQLRKYLGMEFGVSVKRSRLERFLRAMTWVGVGILISTWIH